MRRAARIAFWALASVAVLLAAGLGIFAATFDPAAVFAQAAGRIHQMTGRDLAARDVHVQWSWPPVLVADGLTLSNPPGASRPDMARADLELRPRLLALLSGEALFDVRLIGPDILIEDGNWRWRPVPTPAAQAGSSPARRAWPRPEMASLTVVDARLAYADASGIRAVMLPRLHATRADDGAYAGDVALRTGTGATDIHFAVSGMRDGPLRVTATADEPHIDVSVTLDHGLAGPSEAVAFAAEATTSSGLSFAVKGSIAQPAAGRGLDAQVKMAAASLADASSLFGLTLPPWRNVELQARLLDAAGLQAGIAVRSLRITSPQGDLAGDLALGWAGRPAIRGTLTSTHFDLDSLRAGPIAPSAAPGPPAAPPVRPVVPGEARLIRDVQIPFAPLRRFDADVALSAVNVNWGPRSLPRLEARVLLRDGRLTLDPVSILTEGGALAGAVTADAMAEPPRVTLDVHASALRLDRLTNLLHGPLDVDVALSASGQGTRAMAGTLEGHVGLALVDGDMANEAIEALIEPVRPDRISVHVPGRTAVRCLAVRLDATSGTVTANPLVLDTKRTGLDGHGTVNLTEEQVALQVGVTARLYTASLTTQVDVTGPFAHPVTRYGALGGGIGTGASQIPFDCGPALLLARGRTGPAPASMPPDPPPTEQFEGIRRQLQR